MKRLLHQFAVIFVAAALHLPCAAAERPNIILILADDLGWTDVACMGSGFYETPNVDRLAADGVTLKSFYVCQNCAPTRAALISGQYAPRTGIYSVGTLARGQNRDRKMVPPENQTQLPLEKITLPQALHDAGYVTGMFGKWHLGNDKEHHPSARGFDEAVQSNGRHFNFQTNPHVRDAKPGEYLADFLTDLAVDFIGRHREERFFLYVPHFAVHSPIQAKEELIERYRDRPPVGGHYHATYAAMIQSVDESVGRIVAAVDEAGIGEETLIIFASDNGGVGGYRVPGTDETKGTTDNAPLRGGKGMLYEGGVRVPFIARWTGTIPAGTSTAQPAVHVDLYPTFLELAGAERPADYVLDGESIAAVLTAPTESIDHGPIYWHFPGYLESYIKEDIWRTTPVSVIRDGDWKLLEFFEDGRLELYNLAEDLSETNDVGDANPEIVNRLHAQLQEWRDATGALIPTRK